MNQVLKKFEILRTMDNRSVRAIIFFLLLLIVAFLALAGRCFYLQYFKSDHYVDVCIEQQRSFYPQRPQRGVIVDCRGRVFAASNRVQIIFADPRIIDNPGDVSNKLAPILGMGAHEICRLITEHQDSRYVEIKVAADAKWSEAAKNIYGIGVQYEWLRHYPMGRLAVHVVGFTSVDNRGLGGIEFQYDKELCGSPGQSIFLSDVHRRPVCLIQNSQLENRDSTARLNTPKSDGVGIILTLDASIQEFARAELIKQYESYQAESAVAIVAEPATGAILALVSLPDFDPNNIRPTDLDHLRNQALTDQYEPGSIIKPIIVAIAMDADIVNTHEKIFCENGHYYGKGFGRIGEYHRGFGDLTVREILIQSSNIGMAKIGQRLGKDKLYKGLRLFGFGKETGIDLPGEAEGQLRPTKEWTGYSVTRIPFGQEISVTAIQLVQAFCILANGGHLVHPYLVKAIVDNNGEIIKLRRPPPLVGYIVKPEVAEWVIKDALTGVVNEGTGSKAKLEKWQVFGKTGTAQLANPSGGGYIENAYIASFIAGAPVENPAVIVLVSIRKPNVNLGKGYTGGAVAAPVAAAILEKTLNYLDSHNMLTVPKQRDFVRSQVSTMQDPS
jgi:cell division protein FtsI/penicillin-binding protein 2